MLTWLYLKAVQRMEARYGYDAAYLRDLAEASPTAFRRFARAQMALRHRAAPLPAWFGAQLAATLHEDCGPCVQIVVDMAVEAGVDPALLRALLSGASTNDEARLGFDYAAAVCAGDLAADALRAAIERRWGRPALASLALAMAGARNYPLMKRALGHAHACVKIRLAGQDVAVARESEAA